VTDRHWSLCDGQGTWKTQALLTDDLRWGISRDQVENGMRWCKGMPVKRRLLLWWVSKLKWVQREIVGGWVIQLDVFGKRLT